MGLAYRMVTMVTNKVQEEENILTKLSHSPNVIHLIEQKHGVDYLSLPHLFLYLEVLPITLYDELIKVAQRFQVLSSVQQGDVAPQLPLFCLHPERLPLSWRAIDWGVTQFGCEQLPKKFGSKEVAYHLHAVILSFQTLIKERQSKFEADWRS